MSISEDSSVESDELPWNMASGSTLSRPAQSHSNLNIGSQDSLSEYPDAQPESRQAVDYGNESDESYIPLGSKNKPEGGQGRLEDAGDDRSEGDSHDLRPNSYLGPESTWRSWTKDDRAIANSLAQTRAQHLSTHLFNAHALNNRARQLSNLSTGKGKSKLLDADPEEETEKFIVPKVWTAWPMPPEEVPREASFTMIDSTKDTLFHAQKDLRPSANLQDCLIAVITRASRKRWDNRQWEPSTPIEAQMDNLTSKQVPEPRHGDSEQVEPTDALLETLPAPPMFDSQAWDTPTDDTFPEESGLEELSASTSPLSELDANPVSLSDDDKARRLLEPFTRHLLCKLDGLLMGLHHARQAYAARKDIGDESATDTASAAGSSTSTPGGWKRGRSRERRAPSATSDATMESTASIPPSAPGKRKRSASSMQRDFQTTNLGLRDWSDVLGMAALTGWNEEAVERAAERCAKLFGENMLFRTFHGAKPGEDSHFTESLATGEVPDEEPVPGSEGAEPEQRDGEGLLMLSGAHTQANLQAGGIFCPVKSCHKNRKPFSKGARLYSHVRKMHPDVDVDVVKELETQKRGERRGKWRGEKRRRNPYSRE